MADGTMLVERRFVSGATVDLTIGSVIVVLVTSLFVITAGFAAERTDVAKPPQVQALVDLPATLDGMTPEWTLTGDEALREVTALHLTRFKLASAEVAGYGPSTVVWIGRPADPAKAERMVADMAEAISTQDSPFTPPTRLPSASDVWATTGEGQAHYFFARDGGVWWLSSEPSLGPQVLTALLSEVDR